jgi:hypothetical protein
MALLLYLDVSMRGRQANAWEGAKAKERETESGPPRHAGTCIDPSAMHDTNVHSLHTILAALVLSLRRICREKKE